MDKKIYTVQLKTEDIKTDTTMSGMLIDKMARACGQWEIGQLWTDDWYWREEDASIAYIFDNFDFEKAYLSHLNSFKAHETDAFLSGAGEKKMVKEYEKQKLLLGAFMAVNYPNIFNAGLKNYTEHIKTETLNGDYRVHPVLSQEIESAKESIYKQAKKEWLHGDYHGNYEGVLWHIKKELRADSLEYNEKTDTMTLTFDEDEAQELIGEWEKKITLKAVKNAVIQFANYGQEVEQDKRKREAEKNKAERERIATYKAEQKAEAEAERIAKLKKMTKKSK